MTPLPHPYQLLEQIVEASGNAYRQSAVRRLAQELAVELWKAGQVEHRAMGSIDSEYDPPLWCKGASIEEVTRQVGVPWGASNPARDLGRGRSYR